MLNLNSYEELIGQINKPIIIFNESYEISYYNKKFLSLFKLDKNLKVKELLKFLNKNNLFKLIKEKSSLNKGFSNNYELFINNNLFSINSSIISSVILLLKFVVT